MRGRDAVPGLRASIGDLSETPPKLDRVRLRPPITDIDDPRQDRGQTERPEHHDE